jgi:hypothetical protein
MRGFGLAWGFGGVVGRFVGVLLGVVVLGLVLVSGAFGAGPRWVVGVTPVPSRLVVGSEGQVLVLAWNVGGESSGVERVRLSDVLPAGLTVTSVAGASEMEGEGWSENSPEALSCETVPVECSWSTGSSVFGEALTSYGVLQMRVKFRVEGVPRSVVDVASVEGGEAASVSTRQVLPVVASGVAPFGFERYEFRPENVDGSLDLQAGSHPYAFSTMLGFNSSYEAGVAKPVAMIKDLHVNLPAGFSGDPLAIPYCTEEQFTTTTLETDDCPPQSTVGAALVTVREPSGHLGTLEPTTKVEPVFNLAPAPGVPARLGFVAAVVPVALSASVRTGSDYGLTITNSNVPETAEVLSARVVVWGVPGDESHNSVRGWGCIHRRRVREYAGGCPSPITSQAFLSLPTSCEHAMQSTVEGDSWSTPERSSEVAAPIAYTLANEAGEPQPLTGCDRLAFNPSMTLAPTTSSASSPSGLKVGFSVPQETTLAPAGLAEADLRDTTLTLPEGVQVNAAAANGLAACSGTPSALAADQLGSSGDEIGYKGFEEPPLEPGVSLPTFTSALPGSVAAKSGVESKELLESEGTLSPGMNFCPNASKVGKVKVKTPLLAKELEGGVYLAAQTANPFGSLVALYIVVQDPEAGVLVKLAGEVTLDPVTGRLVSTFKNTPQLPFEELELELFGGATGSLSTPSRCGSYDATVSLAPWSGTPVAQPPILPFSISTGPDGKPCPGSTLPFNPSLVAGSTNNQAAAFSPLTTTIGREDGNQDIQSVQLHLAPGMSGVLAGIPLCPEAQANAGTCSQASRVGSTTASVGVGGDPYTVTGGEVFLTGPYADAPFGLSIVTPAVAGPYNLGKVIVRAKIEIDPLTAAITVTTNEIPHIIQGIPIHLKQINVTIDRSGFTFNPTDCRARSITGTITGTEGATTNVSTPFQAANCATLKFKPQFTVSTSAHTSKADGASLKVKVVYPTGSLGAQANIKSVKVDLPEILPSRLTTLQKACTAKQFEANPAGCPAESIVGHAVVHTPLLPVSLEGPVYFVSHGGEAFPNLTVMLQGDNVKITLVGDTDIKHGITSSTFATTPDVPFETFELVLPQGKYSALTANGNLCQQNLLMPTAFVAQNGATFDQNTVIGVEGCPFSVKHSINKRTLTLIVHAPAAGKIAASGKGLTSQIKTAKLQGNITLKLTQKKAGKLKTTVIVAFTPNTGKNRKKQTKILKITFKK